jgi:hypothetical protein
MAMKLQERRPFDMADDAYVVRYRFTPSVLFFVTLTLAAAGYFGWAVAGFVRNDILRQADTLGWKVAFIGFVVMLCGFIVFFVSGALSYFLAALTRRLALRVDKTGVTLGRAFVPTRAVFVPWRDIAAVVRFSTAGNVNGIGIRTSCVGLRLRAGAPHPPGIPRPGSLRAKLYRLNAGWRPWPVDIFRSNRGYTVDDLVIERMVDLYAPGRRVVWADRTSS